MNDFRHLFIYLMYATFQFYLSGSIDKIKKDIVFLLLNVPIPFGKSLRLNKMYPSLDCLVYLSEKDSVIIGIIGRSSRSLKGKTVQNDSHTKIKISGMMLCSISRGRRTWFLLISQTE